MPARRFAPLARLTLLVALGLLPLRLAGQPYPILDINPLSEPASSLPRALGTVDGRAILVAATNLSGDELWMSDGTVGGTSWLGDLCPGECESSPEFIASDGHRLLFSAFAGPAGGEGIWITDGTRRGTFALASGGVSYAPRTLPLGGGTVSGGLFYFLALDAEHGTELWRSDGTGPGTFRVSEIGPGIVGAEVTDFAPLAGKLIFVADDGRGPALWASDGSEIGTRLLLGSGRGSTSGAAPADLIQAGRYVYFTASVGRLGRELWRTDGTPRGTVNVADLAVGRAGIQRFSGRVLRDRLLFVAEGRGLRQQLWISDGTAASTRVLTHLPPGAAFDLPPAVPGLRLPAVEREGRVLLGVDDGVHGFEPWLSDGTAAGTRLVRDLCPGPCPGWAGSMGPSLESGFLFRGSDGVRGREIWFSDGTSLGTRLTRDLCPGACGVVNSAGPGVRIDSALLFTLKRSDGAIVLARTDGTPRGTLRLREVAPAGALAPFVLLARAGSGVVFSGTDREHGTELWTSDGTAAGTGFLADLDPLQIGTSSFPARFLPSAGGVLFLASDPILGRSLWRSDGTIVGTEPLLPPVRGLTPFAPLGGTTWVEVGGRTYFLAETQDNGSGLWRTDGTASGTAHLSPRGLRIPLRPLTAAGGRIFFLASEPATGEELWVSDGSEEGTHRVVDLEPGARGASIGEIVPQGDRVYFVASAQGLGEELWTSDGTEAGTRVVRDLEPGPNLGSAPTLPISQGGFLYFAARTAEEGSALWRSDGTEAGTVVVARASKIPGVSGITPIGSAGGRLLVAVAKTLGKLEVAVSDGVSEAVQALGILGNDNEEMVAERLAVGGRLYFTVGSNRRLWVSDGTPLGTSPVGDSTGRPVGGAMRMREFDGRLLFEIMQQGLWVTDGSPAVARALSFGEGRFVTPDFGVVGHRILGPGFELASGWELWALEP